jgi:HEPN domain-containing protein
MKNLTKKWLDFARADLEAAEVLLKSGKTHWSYQLCVLHCHQAIEKILKTVIVKNGDEVKKIHDLITLLKDSKLKLPEKFQEHIDQLNPHYQLPRYPDISYK